MILNLDQISNENLVNFYKRELKMIDMGKPASTLFSQSTRRRLIKKGILKQSKGWTTTISDRTRTLISSTRREGRLIT